VAQDEARAAQLLAKAADGGSVEAIDAYGVALWKGRGVKKDPEAAVRQFLRAAEADYPPAMENLSTCYRLGKGVKADERRSLEWKIRSRAARGDRNAQAWLQQNAKKK
jgi:TPR repeat protein